MPKEAKLPILAKGIVQIGIQILPDGKRMPHGVMMEASSGNPELDHAALKALKKSKYPPLPKEFQGPFLSMGVCFEYNMQSQQSLSSDKAPKAH